MTPRATMIADEGATVGLALNRVRWSYKQQSVSGRSNDPSYHRQKDDFYPTPTRATEALLEVEKFGPKVWEPACGDGAISKVLAARGMEVISSDLIDRGYGTSGVDFLMEWKAKAPQLITNPPFRLGVPFVRKALDLGLEKIAMLNKLAFLEGQERGALFHGRPPSRVWVFSRRLSFANGSAHAAKQGGGMLAFAWFIWDRSHVGATTLWWL